MSATVGTVKRAQRLRACGVCGSNTTSAVRVDQAEWVALCRTCGQSRLLIDEPLWVKRAACGDAPDPDLWFDDEFVDEASMICEGCPVWAVCLLEAIHRDERIGVWGGLTRRERASLRRSLRVTTIRREVPSASARLAAATA